MNSLTSRSVSASSSLSTSPAPTPEASPKVSDPTEQEFGMTSGAAQGQVEDENEPASTSRGPLKGLMSGSDETDAGTETEADTMSISASDAESHFHDAADGGSEGQVSPSVSEASLSPDFLSPAVGFLAPAETLFSPGLYSPLDTSPSLSPRIEQPEYHQEHLGAVQEQDESKMPDTPTVHDGFFMPLPDPSIDGNGSDQDEVAPDQEQQMLEEAGEAGETREKEHARVGRDESDHSHDAGMSDDEHELSNLATIVVETDEDVPVSANESHSIASVDPVPVALPTPTPDASSLSPMRASLESVSEAKSQSAPSPTSTESAVAAAPAEPAKRSLWGLLRAPPTLKALNTITTSSVGSPSASSSAASGSPTRVSPTAQQTPLARASAALAATASRPPLSSNSSGSKRACSTSAWRSPTALAAVAGITLPSSRASARAPDEPPAPRARLPRVTVDEAEVLADELMRFADARHVLRTEKATEKLRALGLKLEEGWREKVSFGASNPGLGMNRAGADMCTPRDPEMAWQLDESSKLRARLDEAQDTVSDLEDENGHLREQLGSLSEQIAGREEEFEQFQRLTVDQTARERTLWADEAREERENVLFQVAEARRALANEKARSAQLRLVLAALMQGRVDALPGGMGLLQRSASASRGRAPSSLPGTMMDEQGDYEPEAEAEADDDRASPLRQTHAHGRTDSDGESKGSSSMNSAPSIEFPNLSGSGSTPASSADTSFGYHHSHSNLSLNLNEEKGYSRTLLAGSDENENPNAHAHSRAANVYALGDESQDEILFSMSMNMSPMSSRPPTSLFTDGNMASFEQSRSMGLFAGEAEAQAGPTNSLLSPREQFGNYGATSPNSLSPSKSRWHHLPSGTSKSRPAPPPLSLPLNLDLNLSLETLRSEFSQAYNESQSAMVAENEALRKREAQRAHKQKMMQEELESTRRRLRQTEEAVSELFVKGV